MNLNHFTQRLTDAVRSGRALRRAPRARQLERPRRVDGVELIGQYEDSGLKDPPYIVRRADGQVVQLTRLLYLLTAEADGTRDLEQLAASVSRSFGRPLNAENVAFLVGSKLRPAGLICVPHGQSAAQIGRADPLLALRYRAAVIPPATVRPCARVLRPLFTPFAVGAALSWLVALDLWLVQHGLGTAGRQLIAHPVLLLALIGLVIISALWHELGHATACAYSGATPGAMGLGLYVIWPAFYTDVTDAYRLRRAGRLRTDLGGVYFNALFALAAGGAYFATHYEPLLALVAVQHFQIIQQLTPLMRLDGYYVITDLVGVPDILSRLKPLLLSFLPFRAPDARVSELKPWVRAVTSAYIVLFLAALATLLFLLALNAPHLVPAAVRSAELYSHRAAAAWHRHAFAAAALAEIQVLTVMLPAIGLALGVFRLLRRLGARATSWLDRRVRLGLGMALAAVLGFGWPFLLWGLHPAVHVTAAHDSARVGGHRRASSHRHRSARKRRPRGPASTHVTSASAAPASTSVAAASSQRPTTSTVPASGTPTATSSAASSDGPTTHSSTTGATRSAASRAPSTASTSAPTVAASTPTTTGGSPTTTTTNAGVPTTTLTTPTETTTTPTDQVQTSTGTTAPTGQTGTSTPSS